MHKLIVALAAATALALAGISGSSALQVQEAGAAVKYPAKCKTFKCVNAHLNNLNRRIKALRQFARVTDDFLFGCVAFQAVAVNQFFGYQGTDGLERSALDIANSDFPEWWLIAANPECVSPVARAAGKLTR